jgi:hypothetical protein
MEVWMNARIGTAAGLALAAGASVAALAVQPAQAVQGARAVHGAQGAQAGQVVRTGSAAAGAARCSGSLIDRQVAHYQGKLVAELAVYYDRGRNCAELNHLGVTRGKKLRTSVFLAACKQTRPSRTCTYHGWPAAEDGDYAYRAGPVWKSAGKRCIHAAGDIYFHGKRHLQTRPAASHCR